MSSFAQRVERLHKSTEVLDARRHVESVMEMIAHVPESNLSALLVERLNTIKKKDKHIIGFIDTERKLRAVRDMGISAAISKIKLAETSKAPALLYAINEFDQVIARKIPDFLIVDKFLETFKPYTFDSIVKESYNAIKKSVALLEEDILVSRAIFSLSNLNEKSANFYSPIVERLESYLEGRGREARKLLIHALDNFTFDVNVRSLQNSLKLMESKNGVFQVVSVNDNCKVRPVYSFAIITESDMIFHIEGSYYKKTSNKIKKISINEMSKLPEEYREINEYIQRPNVTIAPNHLSFSLGRTKLEMIFENDKKELHVNGKLTSITEMNDNFVRLRVLDRNYLGDVRILNNIWERLNSLFDVDFCKIVESLSDNGLQVVLFKVNESIYANRINRLMSEDKFYENLNGTQVKNLVLEHLRYDISEGLGEFLSKESQIVSGIRARKRIIIDKMDEVEKNINKIDRALERDLIDIDESDKINVDLLRTSLSEEMDRLKSEYAHLDKKLVEFENAGDESVNADYDIGDWVYVEGKGRGKVISVDTVEETTQIAFDDGETESVKSSDVKSIEDDMQDSIDDNDPNICTDDSDGYNEYDQDADSDVDYPDSDDVRESRKTKPFNVLRYGMLKYIKLQEDEKKSLDSMHPELINPAAQTVEVDVGNQPQYVFAVVDLTYPAHYRGNKVRLIAKDFTSRGENDPVSVLLDSGQIDEVPKKFLQILENVELESPIDGDGGVDNMFYNQNSTNATMQEILKDSSIRLQTSIEQLEDVVAILGNNSDIGSDNLEEIINNLRAYAETMLSELGATESSQSTM